MELTPAERRQVRDGWRSLLYRMSPTLKGKRQFMRELLDLLSAYNAEFLNAMVGDPSELETAAPDVRAFLDGALERGDLEPHIYDVLAETLRVRPRRTRGGRMVLEES